jgi:hypothetical protein|tara:strand:- start:1804 stop:2859 length:1056 start_codon:yes stop_codon:yes gene_type:complete
MFRANEWIARAFADHDELTLRELGAKLLRLVLGEMASRPAVRAVAEGSAAQDLAFTMARECFRRSGRGAHESIGRHAVELWLRYWVVGADAGSSPIPSPTRGRPATRAFAPRRVAAAAAPAPSFRARDDVAIAAEALRAHEASVAEAKVDLCDRAFRVYARAPRPVTEAEASINARQWCAATAANGRRYYYHTTTRETCWTLPAAAQPPAARAARRGAAPELRIRADGMHAALTKLRLTGGRSESLAVAAVRGGGATASRQEFNDALLACVAKAGRGGEEGLRSALTLAVGRAGGGSLAQFMSSRGEEPMEGAELEEFLREAREFQLPGGGDVDVAAFARHLNGAVVAAST